MESVGFTKKNFLKSAILGIIIGLIYFFSADIKSFRILNKLSPQSAKILGNLLIYYFAVGLGEEFLYRGYLQTRLMHWLGEKKGWIFTSIIFAFMHLGQRIIIDKMEIAQAFISCVGLLPVSLLFGYILIKTKNLIPCAILHSFVDFTTKIIPYIR